MMKALTTALAVCLCAFAVSGARLPLQAAPAPGPAASAGNAVDLHFVISANKATFNGDNTLSFANVSQTAQFVASSGRSGIYPMTYFVNTANGSAFVAADGKWLDTPQAALYGSTEQGNQTVVLLSLSNPLFDPAASTLVFNYAVVQPTEAAVKYSGGAVAQAVQQSTAGSGVPALTSVQDGGVLTGVALFIDQNQAAMQPAAATESWWFPWWGGWGGRGWGWGGGWGGGGGWGWGGNGWGNNGWGGGNSQQVVVVNNNNGWGK